MFFGAFALTQAALPVMRGQGSGAIIQISSMGGQMTAPGFGAYCAAKFALEAVSESLSAEVAPFGIRVLKELVEELFREILENVGDREKEVIMRWWYEVREELVGRGDGKREKEERIIPSRL